METSRNDDIEVARAETADGEIEMGPDGDKTVETVKLATLRFANFRAPYTRWNWGNMMTTRPDPDLRPRPQLLRVESLVCEYRYDYEFSMWWAASIDAHTVYAEEDGRDVAPRREQFMSAWGESGDLNPSWVQKLVEEFRPASEDVPPPPRRMTSC